SQVQPTHSIVTGTGERVEPVALPRMAAVLVPSPQGLSTADVYREAERLNIPRDRLDCTDELRQLARRAPRQIGERLQNDLQLAAISLRPELQHTIRTLNDHNALGALVSGSGPTVFGLFDDPAQAHDAASRIPNALVTMVAG